MAEIEMGTYYDVNKTLYENMKLKTEEEVNRIFKDFALLNFLHKNKFYMFLCKERHDYTIFHITGNNPFNFVGGELKETCLNRGKIISVERTEDQGAYEFWLKIGDLVACYLLFPYDYAIVEG